MLAAAQLLPTLELNGLGLRTGGLPYRQAVSFSLRPRLLAQSLLPPFGRGLDAAFGSEGYAEFVGYVGIAALVLAGIGLSLLWRRTAEVTRPPWNVQRATLLAASGFLLALGAYNPLYYLLWRVIPGFDLFRAPARWLELFALGVAALAAFGLDALASTTETRRHGDEGTRDTATRRQETRGRGERGVGANVAGNCAGGPAARRADCHPAAPAMVDAGGLGGRGSRSGRAALGGETLAQVRPRRPGGADLRRAVAGRAGAAVHPGDGPRRDKSA